MDALSLFLKFLVHSVLQHLIIQHTPVLVDYVITGRRVAFKLDVEGVGVSASI